MRATLHESRDPNAVELRNQPQGYYLDLLTLDAAMWAHGSLLDAAPYRLELNAALVVFGRPYTFKKEV